MLIEMTMAIALLLILSAAFYGVWKTIRQMDQTFTSERQAMMVVDNTLERVEGLSDYAPDDVRRIFFDEFGRSGLPVQLQIRPETILNDQMMILSLCKPNGKNMIEVKINAKK